MNNKIGKYIKNPRKIIAYAASKGMFDWMSDKPYLKLLYWAKMGEKLNLDNPRTFNEKIQWLKLYDRNPEYTKLVDKYEVKKYVAEKIGDRYIIPTYGVWNNFDEINFDSLPNQFVLKCTHDCGGIVFCKNKKNLDINTTKKKINRCMKKNYYWSGREWPYKNVKPRIIAEKYMAEEKEATEEHLIDYKFMCFNGKVLCSFTCTDRFSDKDLKVTFYDREWVRMPFTRHYPAAEKDIEKPQHYDEMIHFAELLAEGIPFVRVDFYEIGGQPYFGELTFYPGGGTEEFTPEKWDEIIGSWLKLPVREIL